MPTASEKCYWDEINTMDIKSLKLEEAELSIRSANALHRADVHTVGDMLRLTEEELHDIRNLGAKSIAEILERIEYYKELSEMHSSISAVRNTGTADIFKNKELIRDYLSSHDVHIEALELLPARPYNYLLLNGYDKLENVMFMSVDELMSIHGMDLSSAEEIVKACKRYCRSAWGSILEYAVQKSNSENRTTLSVSELLADKSCRKEVLAYLKVNDIAVTEMGLSKRSVGNLLSNNYHYMSDIIFLSKKDLADIPQLGSNSIKEISERINRYISIHGERIRLFVNGDSNAAISEDSVRDIITGIFDKIGFGGLSLNELISRIVFPFEIPQEMIKKILGQLISEGKLEYVDYRCYRVYVKFIDYLADCNEIGEREKEILSRRLNGQTLDEIGNAYGVTRERVRQIINKTALKVLDCYVAETELTIFDEDYCRYLFETYDFDYKDSSHWLGISPYVWNYFDIFGAKKGKIPLEEAIKDNRNLDAGMRLRIKNYINRNKIYIDGKWIEKTRVALEPAIIKKFCKDETSFSRFSEIFNSFLESENIPFDSKLYYTDDIIYSRKNRVSESRYVLWKHGERFRYYDIDGQDYTELFETLDLGSYKNTEISTVKFMESYPELMEKYDIRDGYELHNLLKKVTAQEGAFAYPDMTFSKMPIIRFGIFDRDSEIYSIMAENAPISMNELSELIHKEYGYDIKMIPNYIAHLMVYYHNGMFRIDHKEMSEERRLEFKSGLTDDFYYFDELKEIYRNLYEDADIDEINSFNLKKMGFLVGSKYALQNFNSAEEYFNYLLKKDEVFDITPLRKRFGSLSTYYAIALELRKNLEIIEYQPDNFISCKRLERSGLSKEMIAEYCDDVFDFAEDETFFTIHSIKNAGFESELFDFGFEDYFYANLLLADSRFSLQKMLGTIILYKGERNISFKDFISVIIKKEQRVDIYELDCILREQYGCTNIDKYDIIFKTGDSGVFYDSELQKFYADQEAYYREIDSVGGNEN